MDKTVKIVLIVVGLVLIIPILLAVIGAVVYFGVLSPDAMLPDRCTISPGFSCMDQRADSATNRVSFALMNNQGVAIQDVSVTLTESRTNTECVRTTPLSEQPIQSGTVFQNEFDCGGINQGNRFQADFTITYTREGGSLAHTDAGTIFTEAR